MNSLTINNLTKEQEQEVLALADKLRAKNRMTDEEIAKPVAAGYSFAIGTNNTRVVEYHGSYNLTSDKFGKSLYRAFDTEAECEEDVRQGIIRRKASLVRKRILREAGYEGWKPHWGGASDNYTAHFENGGFRNSTWVTHCFPGWYYFPTVETRDRFFKIMGEDLLKLL